MSRIKVDRITNRAGTGDPLFPNGISVVGLTSLSNVIAGVGTFSNVTIGGTITYEDVTNQDVIGLSTFRAGVDITGGVLSVASDIVHTGDTDTKIAFTDNQIDFQAHNSSRLYINRYAAYVQTGFPVAFLASSGDSPSIKSGGTNNQDLLLTSGTSNPTRLQITSTGNVGISTANPRGRLHVHGSQVANVTEISGTAIDCASGNYFTKTITGATAFTFTNIPASGTEYSMTVELDLNGNNGVTWPASVTWSADTAPTITDGKTQLFMFVTVDGGTKWRGGTLVDYTT